MPMPRLRRVSPATPGWSRRRAGRGFTYLDQNGRAVPAEERARIEALVIPPAWQDVWICPYPNGHLQATGVDAAGRRQYLYHPIWRERRDRAKFERVAEAAERLPSVRRRVSRDLGKDGMPLERAAALAVRLLDLGYFRVGNDVYAEANGSFGLTTLRRSHVRQEQDKLMFRFRGKAGVEHEIGIADPDVIEAVQTLRRRRGGGRLLAYRAGNRWLHLTSRLVNSYLADLFGGTFTARDFRTWHATVIAAEALALSDEPGTTAASRRRAERHAVNEVAFYLGNTPATARNAYIDPRVFDAYQAGITIGDAASGRYRSWRQRRTALEGATLDLLNKAPELAAARQ